MATLLLFREATAAVFNTIVIESRCLRRTCLAAVEAQHGSLPDLYGKMRKNALRARNGVREVAERYIRPRLYRQEFFDERSACHD